MKKEMDKEDKISAAIMARVLLERENERREIREHRCRCASLIIKLPTIARETQTLPTCTISCSEFGFIDPEEDNNNTQKNRQLNVTLGLPDDTSPTTPELSPSKDAKNNNSNLFDDLMNQDSQTEDLLPTPIFRPRVTQGVPKSKTFSTNLNRDIDSNQQVFQDNMDNREKIISRSVSEEKFVPPQTISSSDASPTSSYTQEDANSNYNSKGYASSSTSSSNGDYGSSVARMLDIYNHGRRTLPGHCARVLTSAEENTSGEHWRTTVLVQPPPRSIVSSSSAHNNGSTKTCSEDYSSSNNNDSDCTKEITPLLIRQNPRFNGCNNSTTTTTISNEKGRQVITTHFNVDDTEDETLLAAYSNSNGQVLNGYWKQPISPIKKGNLPQQYYRAQKRSFWARSSSSTSTETEI